MKLFNCVRIIRNYTV